MTPIKIVAILLIVGGALGLAYGGFSYTKETHRIGIGPVQVEVQERGRFNVPLWAGLGAVIGGLVLLVASGKR